MFSPEFTSLDAAHVCMMEFVLPSTMFETYDAHKTFALGSKLPINMKTNIKI